MKSGGGAASLSSMSMWQPWTLVSSHSGCIFLLFWSPCFHGVARSCTSTTSMSSLSLWCRLVGNLCSVLSSSSLMVLEDDSSRLSCAGSLRCEVGKLSSISSSGGMLESGGAVAGAGASSGASGVVSSSMASVTSSDSGGSVCTAVMIAARLRAFAAAFCRAMALAACSARHSA